MVEASEGLKIRLQKIRIFDNPNMEVNIVSLNEEVKEANQHKEDQMKIAYPREDENLVYFLYWSQKKKCEVMLGPRCSSVYDKKTVENIERV